MGTPGHVYVLLEPMSPNMVKIGRTRRSTTTRVRELHGTGRAVPLIALWDEYVSDAELVEAALHEEFADSRVSSRREFFYLAPKVAIAALMMAAAPLRVHPFRPEGQVEILADLRKTLGDIIRNELTSVEIVVTQESVLLVSSSRTASGDETTIRSNLDFIYDDESPAFTPAISAEENARRFLELDELTLAMTTNLVSDEACERIDREQNTIRTVTWEELSDSRPESHPPS